MCWNPDGFQLKGVVLPPGEISVPRQIREPDFLGSAQIQHEYLDSLVVRFSRGQFHAAEQVYRVVIQPERETHYWEEIENEFPRAVICDPWQADASFCVPTIGWLPDAIRTAECVAIGVTSSPPPVVVSTGTTARLGNLACDIWTVSTSNETRTLWTDPSRDHLILKCFVNFPNGRPRRRYDFEYTDAIEQSPLQRLSILQFTATGGVHDQVILHGQGEERLRSTESPNKIDFPEGTLVSDFQQRAQWLVQNNERRLTTARDTVLRRAYWDIRSGSTPSTIVTAWRQGFPPTNDELWQAGWTWEAFGCMVAASLLFCAIPRKRTRTTQNANRLTSNVTSHTDILPS